MQSYSTYLNTIYLYFKPRCIIAPYICILHELKPQNKQVLYFMKVVLRHIWCM